MVKSYLRYAPSSTLGVIASPNSNIICPKQTNADSRKTRAQPTLAIVGALEAVKIWNVKTSALLVTLHDSPSTFEVTVLAQNPARPNLIAAGYQDGTIRLWSLNENWTGGELVVTFNVELPAPLIVGGLKVGVSPFGDPATVAPRVTCELNPP